MRPAPSRSLACFSEVLRRAACVFLACLLSAPVAAEVLVVTLLGTGAVRPEIDRFGPAVLVQAGHHKLLFDAGRGVAQRIHQLELDFADVNKLFITHLHYDHIVGLPDLLLSGWVFKRTSPLQLWGPPGIRDHMVQLVQAYREDRDLRHRYKKLPLAGAGFEAHEIRAGVVLAEDGLKVTAFKVNHGVVKSAFGYRVDYRGRSLLISGDTRYSENIVRHGRGVDLLIHEVVAATDSMLRAHPGLELVLGYHTEPDELVRVLEQTRPRQAVLVHVLPFGMSRQDLRDRIARRYDGEVLLGEDLMAFDIGDRLRVYSRGGGP